MPTGLFQEVPRLEVLFLQRNKLTILSSDIFRGLHNLSYLILGHNRLTEIGDNIFKDTKNLIFLDLQNNMLSKLPHLEYLMKLAYMVLMNNTLTKLSEKFPLFAKDAHIIVSQPEICKCYTTNTSCTALSEQSPYLTCERLLSNRVLQIFMWVIGINALCGNIFVFIWRKEHNHNNKVQSLLLSNLALSDLLMGVLHDHHCISQYLLHRVLPNECRNLEIQYHM